MANDNVAFGLKPVRMADGSPYNGAVNVYYHAAGDAVALYIGDPVVKAGSADSAGIPSVVRGAAGGPFTGVVQGFVPNGTTDMAGYGAASTAYYVLVCDDPNVLFEIQEDSDGGALAADDIGLNASVIAATANTYSRRSAFMLDTSTKNTTAGLELKIVSLMPKPNNAIGAQANVLVRINDHTEANGTAGI